MPKAARKSKPTPVAVEPEVLEAEAPERALIATDGNAVVSFMNNLVPFFRDAGTLERAANESLVAARALVEPTDFESDERIKTFVRSRRTAKKALETLWAARTPFHAIHKLMTAAFKRVEAIEDQAADIAQRHHNAWVAVEARRRAVEDERARVEAARVAEQARQDELDALEAIALKAEEGAATLSEREQAFVKLMAAGGEPVNSAKLVGYRDPAKAAAGLVSKLKIQRAICAQEEATASRQQAAAVAAQPLDIQPTRSVSEASTSGDRTTKTMVIDDPVALRNAICDGTLGIPRDILEPSQPKGNEYARSLGAIINAWPGCRYVETKRTV